jgi:Phage late-transcription coactivator
MATKDEIQTFSEMIMRLATEKRIEMMEAVCLYCEQTGLEIEVAATLLSQAIKSKIQEEATNLNLLKKEGRLPI